MYYLKNNNNCGDKFSVSIRLPYAVFSISKSGYYYQPNLKNENEVIADELVRLTSTQSNWGFGLCFFILTQY